MKRNNPLLLFLIATVFTLSILSAPVHALTPDKVFDKVKDSVVVVKTLDAQGKEKGQGSGVLLPSGKIATNCHVVKGGAAYQVGRGKQLVRATLYAEDEDKDICLLDAEGITGEPAQLGKAADLKVGVPVYAVGAPQGLELSLSDGIVAQLRGSPPPLIQTTAAISPGSSGGGLFDAEGRLVGLTTLYIKGGQNLNFAMPVEWIDEIKPGLKKIAKEHGQIEWLTRVIELEISENWRGLLDWCLMWTKSEPNDVDAWVCLGDAYSELKRYNEAFDAFRQALRINPKHANSWLSLGDAYSELKRYSEAIDAYHQALRIDRESADAWVCLGLTYVKLQRYNEAVDAFRQVLRFDPEYPDAWYDLGNAYTDSKRYNEAIDAFRQALRINPKHANAWNNLGVAYARLQRNNEAIDAFRQALRINPEDAKAWLHLGVIYRITGNRSAALEVVSILRRLDPESADKLFNVIVPR